MSIELTPAITSQISNKDIKITFIFEINDAVFTSYVMNYDISYDIKFGAASGLFILDNNDGKFSTGGASEIKVGDKIEFIEKFTGDATEFKNFYGVVSQRSISKTSNSRTITLNCLDYLSVLKNWTIDMESEGTRVKVTDEVLDPNYLDPPNEMLAQIFNFANDDIATKPMPTIQIRDKNHADFTEAQFDGFEILYSTGQVKLGTSLQARDNYEVLSSYSYYTKGKAVEDVIEEILTEPDGYSNYLFDESTAQAVITNHLTSTINTEEGTSTDTLTPNSSSSTITIETTLTADIVAGSTSVSLTDGTGFPSSGSGSINGDIFTWTGNAAGTLTGIPNTGSNSLNAHSSGDYVEYEETYAAGRVWATLYDNINTTLTSADFTIGGGGTFLYFDKQYGRLILTTAISILSTVTCNTDYSFSTLQASAIEINRITFRTREIKNRFDALSKLRQYVAPNYIIRTQGDGKIWASYFNQKSTANYTINLMTKANYLQDSDLYTRVYMWAKNKQPTNIMFGEAVDYSADTEDSYTGTATTEELSYFGEEKSGELSSYASGMLDEAELLSSTSTQNLINFVKDKYINKDFTGQESTGYHVYGTTISDDRGKIILDSVTPAVFINGAAINNTNSKQTAVPIKVKTETTTISDGGGKSKSVSVHTYYQYSVILPHTSIVPSEPILMYDSQGILKFTLNPNDANVDYGNGVIAVDGAEQNSDIESLSTATYHVLYSTDKLKIEYDDVIFKIHNSILPNPDNYIITATFEYWAIAVGVRDINAVVDGRRDTQLQLEFFGKPPAGFHLSTIDLGSIQTIQAIDITGGHFKPDGDRKFDMSFTVSMESSTDGINFSLISDKTENFEIKSGDSMSFEEEDLGASFEARYLKFNLQDVERIEYGRGRYVVAINEISVYNNIILESLATLISTTKLTKAANSTDTSIEVSSTSGFTDPESGETGTAYVGTDSFTYNDLTSTTFRGIVFDSGFSTAAIDTRVSQTIESDTSLYDDDSLLPHLKDRVYKKNLISDRNLFLQSDLDDLSKNYLKEFVKAHSKIQVDLLFCPYLRTGQTTSLTDSYNNISDVKYFIESVKNKSGNYAVVLARYP